MKLNLKRLKAERVAKGLTQDDMARLMGWQSRTPYVKRENGYVPMGVDDLIKITQILGYPIDKISIFFTQDVPECQILNVV